MNQQREIYMSQITRDINKVTGTVIGVSGKLIVYAVVIILFVEGMTRGYAFGHSIFYAKAMEPAPGTPRTLGISQSESTADIVKTLKGMGLIDNELATRIQMEFYDYEPKPGTYSLNTAMTSKEILQILNAGPKEEEEGSVAIP